MIIKLLKLFVFFGVLILHTGALFLALLLMGFIVINDSIWLSILYWFALAGALCSILFFAWIIGCRYAKSILWQKIIIVLLFYVSMGIATLILGVCMCPHPFWYYFLLGLFTPIGALPITIYSLVGLCKGSQLFKISFKWIGKVYIVSFIYIGIICFLLYYFGNY